MKRFSKITACLLAVLMILGAIVVSVSAVADTEAQLTLEGKVDGVKTSASTTDFSDKATFSGLTSGQRGAQRAWGETPSGNVYFNVYADGTKNATQNKPYWGLRMANGAAGIGGIFANDIVIYDIDISADSYVITKADGFGSAYADLEADENGNAVYKADNSAGVDAGTPFLVNDANVKLADIMIKGTDLKADAEGYAVWVEGNSQNQTADSYLLDQTGNKWLLADLKLSYVDNSMGGSGNLHYLWFAMNFKQGSSTQTLGTCHLKYDEANNSWSYVFPDGTKAPLSNKVGEWNHLTVVAHFANTVDYTLSNGTVLENQPFNADIIKGIIENGSYTVENTTYTAYAYHLKESKAHWYMNGEYYTTNTPITVTTNSTTVTAAAVPDLYEVRFQLYNVSTYPALTNYIQNMFSMGFDNLACNYYSNSYEGPVRDFVENNPESAIYNIGDVVYNGEYKTNNGYTGSAYANANYEAEELDPLAQYHVAKGAVDYAIANNGVAVISSDVTDYRPAGENLPDKFFVKCENGAKFTLAPGCGYYLLDELDANGFWVAERSKEVNVFWFLSEDDFANIEPAAEGVLLVGDSYEYAGSDFEAVDTYLGDGKTKAFIGWKYAVHLEGEFKFFEGDVITSEIYDEVQAAADAGLEAVLIVMPAYETKEAYFSVTKGENTTFYYTAEDMMTALDGITGVNTVVLYKDVIVTPDSSKWVAIPGSGTFNIDVNGHTLGMKAAASSATGYRFFRVASGKDYNFYSSAPGGKILINSGRLIDGNGTTNDTQGCIVNIGTIEGIEGANGANLQLHVGQLMFSSPSNREITENILTIKDTVLFVTHRVAGVRCPWTVNIDNSTVVANDSQSSTAYSLFRAQGNYGALNINITNSTILSVSEGAAKFSIFNTETELNVITAKISNTTLAENDMFIDMETEGATIEIDLAADVTLQLNGALADGAVAIPEGYKLVRVSLDGITKNGLTVLDAAGVIRNIDVVGSNTNYGYKIVPEATEVVTANGVLANITTGNGFWVNFYVPTSLGLEIVGEANGTTVIGGVEYAVYTVKGISPTSVKAATISFKAMTVGEVDYYKTISVSLPEYFTAVITAEGATEAEKALAVNGANYCNELYKISKSAGYSVYNEIVEANADLLVATPALESVGTVTNTAAVNGATLMIGDGNVPMFAFTKAGEAVVTVKYVDIYGNEQTVTCEVVSVTTTVAGEEGEEPTEVTVEYYVVKEMHVYDMIGTIVVYADGEEALTYSIADYINALKAEETPDEKSIAIAEALYGYAKAVIAFKKS